MLLASIESFKNIRSKRESIKQNIDKNPQMEDKTQRLTISGLNVDFDQKLVQHNVYYRLNSRVENSGLLSACYWPLYSRAERSDLFKRALACVLGGRLNRHLKETP